VRVLEDASDDNDVKMDVAITLGIFASMANGKGADVVAAGAISPLVELLRGDPYNGSRVEAAGTLLLTPRPSWRQLQFPCWLIC
jgi:hypothetical protein